MADKFIKRKIGDEDILREVEFFDERKRKPQEFRMKEEQEFRKRRNETTSEEAIATLNFAIRKALSEGGTDTARALNRIKEESIARAEEVEFFDERDEFFDERKPKFRPKRKLR